MKSLTFIPTLLSLAISRPAQAQLVLPLLWDPTSSPASPAPPAAAPSNPSISYPQAIRKPQIAMPATPDSSTAFKAESDNPAVMLSDVLGGQEKISIFAGFTQDVDSVAARLEDGLVQTTILAPRNAAIMDLPRKPWEGPDDGAMKGKDGQSHALKNLQRFTEAHVVPTSPWKEGQACERMDGKAGAIWWERDAQGTVRVMPGAVEVEGVANRVANGEVWILKGVLNFEV